jgi:hypothetical protein
VATVGPSACDLVMNGVSVTRCDAAEHSVQKGDTYMMALTSRIYINDMMVSRGDYCRRRTLGESIGLLTAATGA